MPPNTPLGRRAGVLALVGLLAIAMLGQPVAAQSADEPAFIVALDDDGSAEVTVWLTFDLTTDDEQQAFQTLQNDDQARQAARDRFRSRLQVVAADASNATGRDMRVTDASIELRQTSDGQTGVVELVASWSGLAAVEGDTLVVTEPFASGFTTERSFVILAPDGYEISSATPEPDATGDGRVSWDAGANLDGFEVVLEPSPTQTTTQSPGQAGFGLLIGAVSILAALLAAATRKA